MTDQTPATEAGRALAEWMRTKGATPRPGITADDSILAIEAEARADTYTLVYVQLMYEKGRADARREAAEAVRSLTTASGTSYVHRADVLAILHSPP